MQNNKNGANGKICEKKNKKHRFSSLEILAISTNMTTFFALNLANNFANLIRYSKTELVF